MRHTERTQHWLDDQVTAALAARPRTAHPRRYSPDDVVGRLPVGHVVSLARSYSILTALATVNFHSCLDVGSGDGRLSHLIATLYGAECAGVDLSREFALVARRDFGVPVYVANAAVLPFADEQFDLVLCSEVLEHSEHPFAVMAELWRVARRAVLITTQESCRHRWHRRLSMAAVEQTPHAERSYFLPGDFRSVYGAGVEVHALLQMPERIRLFALDSVTALQESLCRLAEDRRIGPGSFGVLVIARKAGGPVAPRVSRQAALDLIVATDRHVDLLAAGESAARGRDHGMAPRGVPMPAPRPVCPECRGGLEGEPEGPMRCRSCAAVFPVYQGIPLLLGSEAAVNRNATALARRPELEPLRRALSQRPLRWRLGRMGVRAAVKLLDFLTLPLPWTAKLRLSWRYLTWR